MGFNQGGPWLFAVLTLGGLCSPVSAGGWSTERDIPASTMSAMASSSVDGPIRVPGHLLDGKPETFWVADFNDTNPTITLNLGSTVFDTPPAQPVTIAAVRELNAGSAQGISQYDILVSADSTNGRNGTWTHVASGIWMYPLLASGAGTEMRAWFHPVAAKYLRLEIRGKEWFKVSEMRVERAGDAPPTFPEIQRPEVTVDTNAPAPADVEAQARCFAERNSPEQVKKLATELFGWLDLDHPDLATVKKLYTAGDYGGALRAYRAFFLSQMRDTKKFWDMRPFDYFHWIGMGGQLNYLDVADEQMFNITTLDNPQPRKKVALGEPGRINWTFDKQMQWQEQFYPLLHAYLEKGDPRYLAKWAEFADDWALNKNDLRSALDQGYNGELHGCAAVLDVFKHISWLALALPEDGSGLSETTLARVLLTTMREYPAMGVVCSRHFPQNWQTGTATEILAFGIALERVHFKLGSLFMQEGIRGEAAYHTHCAYLDGTEIQRDIWYNQCYIEWGVVPILNTLQAFQPKLLTPDWDLFFRDSARARHAYRVRIMYPSGQLPQVLRNEGYVQIPKDFYDLLPWHTDPDLPVLMDLYAANAQKKEPAAFPSFTSDAYPYAGYYLIRQGWRLTDQQGTFYNAGRPSHGKRMFADNKFALHAFGEDLISAGEVGAYSQIPSPLTVDGRRQDNAYGCVTFGHKLLTPPVSDSPNTFRWHNSERYDLVEGIYDGAYSSSNDGTLDLVSANKTLIKDVTFQRWVQFLRRHGLWIVTDRIASPATHAYAQRWDFVAPADQVHCDPQQQTVETQVEKAAVKLQQFTQDSLKYEVKTQNGKFKYTG
ncbi:MAG: discoidin domain-containing protein [bacterium]